jgi:serine/threonine protein kinase
MATGRRRSVRSRPGSAPSRGPRSRRTATRREPLASGVDDRSQPAVPERLTAGEWIGPYRVESFLGRGGMGEVYSARDTTLGRDVAIKMLPAGRRDQPRRVARFEREARVLAALNHPHIGAIYGIVDAHGTRSLVLELVDGQTLSDRLCGLPLPLTETLPIARQIADALGAAHAKGIVHRDLKPANLKITADGVVKLLDFGLAKLGANADASPDAPTMTVDEGDDGHVTGTAAYMSPEQARGKPVDKRTDIWSFGCVLYEMLTARRAFFGETSSDTIAAVLDREPDLAALPPTTPLSLRRLLIRCLEKDPKRRLQDVGDAIFDLDEAVAECAASRSSVAGAFGRRRRWQLIAAGVALPTLVGTAWLWF